MKLLEWLSELFGRLFGRRQVIRTELRVKTQEQADAINGFFHMPNDVFMSVTKLSEPSYGRLVTFEFDTSVQEGRQALEWLKVISEFNGNGYADIRVDDNLVTMEFSEYEDAEAMRVPWRQFREYKRKLHQESSDESAAESEQKGT